MKIHIAIVSIFSISAMALAGAGGPGSSLEKSNIHDGINVCPYTLKVGQSKIPVIFEDSDCSKDLMKAVVEDLNTIYSHRGSYKVIPHKGQRVQYNGHEYIVESQLYFDDPQGDYRPRQLSELFGDLVSVRGQESVFIPTEMSDIYQNALNRKFAKESIYSELDALLKMLNDLANADLSDESVRELFYYDKQQKTIPADLKIAFIESYGKYEYRTPSILQVLDPKDDQTLPDEMKKKFTLCAYIYRTDRSSKILSPGFLAVYDQNRWKIYVPSF